MTESHEHTRSYSWLEPQRFIELAQGKSGLEFMQLLAEEGVRYGPFWQTLSVKSFEVLEPGKVLFTAQPGDFHYNIIGSVHGGFSSGLMKCTWQALHVGHRLATAEARLVDEAGQAVCTRHRHDDDLLTKQAVGVSLETHPYTVCL
jgi:acyl-coenzyme A thioesterase PaaI-like protein